MSKPSVAYRRIGASFHGQILRFGEAFWTGPKRPSIALAKKDAEAASNGLRG